MKKNLYVPDDKRHVFEEAEKLFPKTNISQLVIELIEKAIQEKKEMMQYETFILDNLYKPVKLIGKKLVSFHGRFIRGSSEKHAEWIDMPFREGEADVEEINAYRTRKKRFFVEIKFTGSGGYMRGELIEIADLWEFTRSGQVEVDYKTKYGLAGGRVIQFPEAFMQQLKTVLGDDFVEEVIE